MPKTHPNLRKMQRAVDGWIEAANGRMDGAEALAKRVAWFDEQIAKLGRGDLATPEHLVGLTVWDLMRSQGELSAAAKVITAKVQRIRAAAQTKAAA
jgi:hypothetical protein